MKNFFLIILFIIAVFTAQAQNSYYVATNGNNSNNGSITNPWRTIQYGVDQLNPQDTLFIRGGTYEEKININVSGNQIGYITIRNYQNEDVILDAINFHNPDPIIWTDKAYLHIEGLHLTNNIKNYAEGIKIGGTAHHIEIINNKISNIRFSSQAHPTITPSKNAVPLNIWAEEASDSIHDIIIRGNEVFNNMTGYSENITGNGNFSTFIIEDNLVHDNSNIGIDVTGNYGVCPDPNLDHARNGIIRNNIVYNCDAPYSTSAGIYVDGGKNILIENNISHHNGYGIEVGCEENGSTSNVTVRNNIIYNNSDAGIAIGAYDTNTTGNVIDTYVYGNTFYKNDIHNNYNGEIMLTKLDNCKIKNNIFYTTNQNVLLEATRTQTNFDFDYNLVYKDSGTENLIIETSGGNYHNLSDYYNASGQGAHAVFGDPLFLDTNTFNFHIAANSIAIDAGDPSYTASNNEVDMDNENRIYNNIIDCGADEYDPNSGIDDYAINFSIAPNPVKNILTIETTDNVSNYKIYSIYGSLVAKGKIKHHTINISKLKKGIYLLQITNDKQEKFYPKKIIKL